MKNYQIRYAVATVQAATLAEAIALAIPVVVDARETAPSGNLIDQIGSLIRDLPVGASVAVEEAPAPIPVSASPTEASADSSRSPIEGTAAPAGEFVVGESYKSDSGKWTGKITYVDRSGNDPIYSVDLRSVNGDIDSRDFELTENGNLRSMQGNIVLRTVNRVR